MNSQYKLVFTILFSISSFSSFAEQWKLEFTPYIWAAANKGATGAYVKGANGRQVESLTDIDIDFQDFVDHLEYGTMFNFAATKNDWLIYTEFTHLSVTDDQASTAGPNGNVAVDLEIEITGSIWDVMAGYRLLEKEGFNLYAYGGIRYFDIESKLGVDTNPDLLSIDATLGDDFTDAIVGMHMNWQLNDTFTLQGKAEVGGFSDQPKEDILVNVSLTHRLSKQWELKYFYRFMSIDYSGNSFIYDMEVTGPGIGASYLF